MDYPHGTTRLENYWWSAYMCWPDKSEWCLYAQPISNPIYRWIIGECQGQEVYSLTNGFFGYHHIRIAKEDQHKTNFAMEWGCFQYMVMPFGLKNAPAKFSRIAITSFKYFIHKFLEVYFDEWIVFGIIKDHI